MGFRDLFASKVMPSGGIDVDTALHLLAAGAVLIDVRTLPEYEAGHVPAARFVDSRDLAHDPFNAVFADDPFADPAEAPRFILICDTGLRSGHLVDAVREHGFECDFVTGGVIAWKASGQVIIPGPPRRRF